MLGKLERFHNLDTIASKLSVRLKQKNRNNGRRILTLNREVELVSDAAVGSEIVEETFLPNTGVEGAELRRLSTALSYEVSTMKKTLS